MFEPLERALQSRPSIAGTLTAHAKALRGGTLSPRIKELCALMVAWLNACEYCTSCHEDLAEKLGIDRGTLEELGNYARSDRFNPRERAALSAAVALTREPRGIPPAVRADLEANFDAPQIVEVIATIGFYNYLTRLTNALQLDAILS